MKKNQALLVFAVLLILAILFFYWHKIAILFNPSGSIAKVESLRGKAFKENRMNTPVALTVGAPLSSYDVVSTDRGGQLIISIPSERARLRLNEEAQISLIASEFSIDILIKKGQLDVIDAGLDQHLYVIENGDRVKASLYPSAGIGPQSDLVISPLKVTAVTLSEALDDDHQLPTVPKPQESRTQSKPPPPSDDPEKIKTMLSSRLNSRVGFFYRCYSHLLQRDSSAQGQIQFQISVLPNGDVKKIVQLKSDFSDQEFTNCLSDVIRRTPFTPFNGNPAALVLPLVFDKNSQAQ